MPKEEEGLEITPNGAVSTVENKVKIVSGGALHQSLTRKGAQIRLDRAQQLVLQSVKVFERRIEDLDDEMYQLKVDRDNRLDVAPAHVGSLQPAKDFDPNKFINDDLEDGLRLREKAITSNTLRARYNYLFYNRYEMLNVETI